MGKSTSKPSIGSETVQADVDQQGCSTGTHTTYATHELGHDQSSTTTKKDVTAKTSRLSAIGKRTSFYETVDADEVLPYLLVG